MGNLITPEDCIVLTLALSKVAVGFAVFSYAGLL